MSRGARGVSGLQLKCFRAAAYFEGKPLVFDTLRWKIRNLSVTSHVPK